VSNVPIYFAIRIRIALNLWGAPLTADLGRQFLTQGFKESAALMCSKVDDVTKADVHRVATRLFRPDSRKTPLNAGIGSGEPTIVGIGKNVEGLGDVRSILRKWDLGAKQ